MFKYYKHISMKHGYQETIVINCTVNIERNAIGSVCIKGDAKEICLNIRDFDYR